MSTPDHDPITTADGLSHAIRAANVPSYYTCSLSHFGMADLSYDEVLIKLDGDEDTEERFIPAVRDALRFETKEWVRVSNLLADKSSQFAGTLPDSLRRYLDTDASELEQLMARNPRLFFTRMRYWFPNHALHLSTQEPPKIAYFNSERAWMNDRPVRTTLGRYLGPRLPEGFSQPLIAALASFFAGLATKTKLHITESSADVEWVYRHGPSSCMSYPADHFHAGIHPTRAYGGDSDFQVAYITDGNKPTEGHATARTVIVPSKKLYIRIYGDAAKLRPALEAQGYTEIEDEDDLCGLKLNRITNDVNGLEWYVGPYVDNIDTEVTDDGSYLYICGPGNTVGYTQISHDKNGYIGNEDHDMDIDPNESHEECTECGDRIRPDHDTYLRGVEEESDLYCTDCCTGEHRVVTSEGDRFNDTGEDPLPVVSAYHYPEGTEDDADEYVLADDIPRGYARMGNIVYTGLDYSLLMDRWIARRTRGVVTPNVSDFITGVCSLGPLELPDDLAQRRELSVRTLRGLASNDARSFALGSLNLLTIPGYYNNIHIIIPAIQESELLNVQTVPEVHQALTLMGSPFADRHAPLQEAA